METAASLSFPRRIVSESADGFRLFFSIRKRPTGPPKSAPDTRPKVAAAIAIVLASSRPALSRIGAHAAAVPFPPTIGIEPVASPIREFNPMTLQSTTPRPFCKTTRILDKIRKTITCGPPFFSIFQLAV